MTNKRLGVEETLQLMINLESMKDKRNILFAKQLNIQTDTNTKDLVISDEVKKAHQKNLMISAVVGFIVYWLYYNVVSISQFTAKLLFIANFVKPSTIALIVGGIVWLVLFFKLKNTQAYKEYAQSVDDKHIENHTQTNSLIKEIEQLENEISITETMLTNCSVVPIRFQKKYYVQTMVEYLQEGIVKTDIEAIKQVAHHFTLRNRYIY